MSEMKSIIKAKLARGGNISTGELAIVVRDLLNMISDLETRIEEQDNKLDALSRGSNRGTKKSSKPTEVHNDEKL